MEMLELQRCFDIFISTLESILPEKRLHKAVPSLAFFSSSSNRDTQSADLNTFEDVSDLYTSLFLSAFLATIARALRIPRRISASLVEKRPTSSSSRGLISCNVGVGPAHVATSTREGRRCHGTHVMHTRYGGFPVSSTK